MTSSESPTHPDAPRAGGETPDIAAILATVSAEDLALVEHLERCTHMHVTSTEHDQVNAWADRRNRARVLLLQRMAALLARHRDGEREPLPAPSEIADLPAMTPIANVIRRSAYYVLNYHGATFASEKDAAGVAGHIAVSVTMANGFEDALHAALSAPPSPERASHD